MVQSDQFGLALRSARLAESAQLEAMLNIQDARVLRLENLREAVLAKLVGNAQAQSLFELVVRPGTVPKLWVDLISSVVMEPDPRTYRLVQDNQRTYETIFETTQMTEMVDYVVRFMAHRVIAQQKAEIATSKATSATQKTYSLIDMIYVWATGCVFGIMILLTLAMYLGKLQF
jgi:hypothetical protein